MHHCLPIIYTVDYTVCLHLVCVTIQQHKAAKGTHIRPMLYTILSDKGHYCCAKYMCTQTDLNNFQLSAAESVLSTHSLRLE